MTDFTLHSIGIILSRLGRADTLLRFVEDLFVEGGVTLVAVAPERFGQVIGVADQFGLDFDDAYQMQLPNGLGRRWSAMTEISTAQLVDGRCR
jgi:predicted nucleic acid-binding protein